MQCEFALLHLCLPLDVEAIGIKKAEGAVQAKEDREGRKAETEYKAGFKWRTSPNIRKDNSEMARGKYNAGLQ